MLKKNLKLVLIIEKDFFFRILKFYPKNKRWITLEELPWIIAKNFILFLFFWHLIARILIIVNIMTDF